MKRKIGPVWEGRGRPAAGYFTKRLAEDWLRDALDDIYRARGSGRPGPTASDRTSTTWAANISSAACARSARRPWHHVRPGGG
jgi:hypothetical protein